MFRRFLPLVLITLFGLVACKRERTPGPAPSASARTAAVPAPAGLIADLVIQRPSKTWPALRALGGRSAELLPENFQLLFATVVGLSPLAADSIDGELPLFGALVDDAGSGPSLALAIHVSDGRELIAKLTTGNEPSFRADPADTSGLVALTQVRAEPKAFALGILDNYLLIGARPTLARAGPYIARSLPARPLPEKALSFVVPKEALSGSLSNALRRAWQARRAELEAADRRARDAHGGRAPDFADPAAVVGAADALIQSALAVLSSADRLEIGADLATDAFKMKLEIIPSPDGAAAALGQAMKVGDVEALRTLPAGTRAALLLHNEAGTGAGEESAGEGFIKLFGERLNADEARRVKEVFAEWEAARGELSLYAAVSQPVPAILFSSRVRDGERFGKSARGVFELLKLKSISEPLRELAGTPQVALSRTRVAGVEQEVERASVTFKRAQAKGPLALIPDKVEFLWLQRDGQAYAAVGQNAAPALAELLATARGERENLRNDAWLENAAKPSAGQVATALFVDLAALLPAADAGLRAPLLLLLGKDAARSWLSVDASKPAIEILLKAMVGR